MIDTIADHTRERLNNMTPEELDANSVFFANQADSLDGARQKRIFDHNRVVLPIIEGKLAASGITLAYNDFGNDIGNQAQKVFNIDKTIAASPDVDPEDVRNALQKALDEEYDPDRYYNPDGSPGTKAAIDHKNVISSFTQALNKSQGLSCTSE
ncbi:hypothetical protein PFICI_06740 [Pestalotiopsis fici W106-1]|uniref:Uncharacterized protein n=1 Tax=Pestalotiopsis fici (strain W106-1 / CGMCC3.15140) TaxID=1229662 RepID=W3X6L3_PESFW|nr:uncharacterized protein PFICI_06740 [Pestalotiopsis fici W106-1]ETS81738.1 hypothetical protein PFICI_06740 [Pestalotiopsis fici W106-1]